ncbi:MAG TPA: AAA family ATPase, partial [Actinospica sp.]|nr:AAA family ATPase [Actinospica sp.]
MRPTLIVLSGPPGTGKTTLAHRLAEHIGCPAISRDEIKEGMLSAALSTGAPAPGDLNLRTLPAFFAVLRVLLEAGVTTVAEAAFQHHVWQPRLEPLMTSADVRLIQCRTDEAAAHARISLRDSANPTRKAHDASEAHRLLSPDFVRLRLDVPSIDVDTTDGYSPGLDAVARFA